MSSLTAEAPYGLKKDGTPAKKRGRKPGAPKQSQPKGWRKPGYRGQGNRELLDASPGRQTDRAPIIAAQDIIPEGAGGRATLPADVATLVPPADPEPPNLHAKEYFVRIIGRARPKARARFFATKSGKVGSYTPGDTAEWESEMRRQMLENAPRTLFLGPIEIEVWFFLPRPLTLPKKVKWPTKKPDADNLKKSVMDVARGIYYKDDAQIVDAHQHKRYCAVDEVPYVTVRIRELEE